MSNKVSRTVTDQELNAIMYIESAGNPNARAKTSTAEGLGQFLKGTWRDTVRKHRPDVFKAIPNGKLLAMRRGNPSFMIEMLARFTEDNRRTIGANATLGDLYLAHFLGAGDAKKLYQADPDTQVSAFLSQGPIKANPSILRGKTAGQVRRWAELKMMKASKAAGDYVSKFYTGRFELPMTAVAEVESEGTHEEMSSREVLRPGLRPDGDARLYDNQLQLKSMNYNPGGLDGKWGGMTRGALAGFLGDRGSDARVPQNWQQYDRDYEKLDAIIDLAESEGWRRPVTQEREDADPNTIERSAPEIVPANRTWLTAVTGFFGAIGSTIYKGVEWLMGYQDQAERWGLFYYIDKVPGWVWGALGAAVFGALIFFSLRTYNGIVKPITTGARN